jgi:hypothetical protein
MLARFEEGVRYVRVKASQHLGYVAHNGQGRSEAYRGSGAESGLSVAASQEASVTTRPPFALLRLRAEAQQLANPCEEIVHRATLLPAGSARSDAVLTLVRASESLPIG